MTHLTYAEIDLNAIAHNTKEIRRITQPDAALLVAVKANAYGHGSVPVARTALENGADWLGVARIEEGIELRRAGIDAPILIFGFSDPERTADLLEWNLAQTVYDLETAGQLSQRACSLDASLKIHIKIDTGMGRLGLPGTSKEEITCTALPAIESILRMPGLETEGIFTHFASSDSRDKSYADQQFQCFKRLLDALKTSGIDIPIRHAANSGAIIDLPDTHLDMVRAGISLYGLYPSDEVDKDKIELKPAMTLKTRITHLKTVPAGFSISYGMTYKTPKPSTIATVAVGYADGYNRLLSSKGHMLIRSIKVPVVGRICMDLTMLDVSGVKDVKIGDEVVIFGTGQDGSCLPADELADAVGTINYEIVSSLTRRVQRTYIPSGD